jgi:hypothetical protein
MAVQNRYAIFALLVTMTIPAWGQTPPNSPVTAERAKSKSGTAPSQVVLKSLPEVSQPPAPVKQSMPVNTSAPNHVAIDSIPAKDKYDWIAYGGSILLAAVGVVGVIVGICSLIYLRRQTEATLIAANAALTQANHIATSERAWIEVLPYIWSPDFYPRWEQGDPVPEGPMGIAPISHLFQAQIKNVGRTPARIEGISVRYVRSSRKLDQMGSEPDYGEMSTEDFFLLPNTEMQVTATLSPERGTLTKSQIEGIRNGTEVLFAYGIIKYRDVYNSLHETRFGYAYRTPETHYILKDGKVEPISFGKAVFAHGGPAAYNRVT